MALQTLPPTAIEYSATQIAAIDSTVARVSEQWRGVGAQFDTGWRRVGPAITQTVKDGQRGQAVRATAFIPAVLAETGQSEAIPARASLNIEALVGVTGAGFGVSESLGVATIRAKQAIEQGKTVPQALDFAGDWLAMTTATILADTARTAESIGRYTRDVDGYVRMVHRGACGRCVVLAGRWYRSNAGFDRHPDCKCTSIPASESVAGDWQVDPEAYFRSLDTAQQIKLMGSKANAQAVIDGADIGQLVNAYRRSSGMQFAQVSPIKKVRRRDGSIDKFTTEGTTRRASAAQQQAGLRRNGPLQQRLMPESIARIAKDDADRMRLLRLYGWVRDDAATVRGRAVLAEVSRVERNARARARRAERASN